MDLQQQIRQRGHYALKSLYKKLRAPFLQYMKRYTNDGVIRQDAFHEAMIAFYEYCLAGKYDPAKSSPKTLVFKMGSAYLINRLKKDRRMISGDDQIDRTLAERMDNQMQFELTSQQSDLKEGLLRLGDQCRKLLAMFYYDNFPIDVIRVRMGYKNDNVVSSHKSRCIQQLRKLLQK